MRTNITPLHTHTYTQCRSTRNIQPSTSSSLGTADLHFYHGGGGDGGSFHCFCKDLGVTFDNSSPTVAFFTSFFLLFFKRKSAEMTVAECLLISCVWAPFSLTGSYIMPGQHSQPTPTLLGQMCMHSGVTCHFHFWQNDQGLLQAAAVIQGGTDTK